jgi:hypothetical protein
MRAEFLALGGTVENIELRQGPRGRGIFPIDPTKPARLHVAPNLLVRSEDTEIREGQLVVKASVAVMRRERAFFENYQRDFSWGAGVFEDLWQAQLAWSQIPEKVQAALKEIAPGSSDRFLEPSPDICHKRYLRTRQITYRGKPVLMPLVELVNHGIGAKGYDQNGGIDVGGNFEGEVLVSYGADDCWGLAVTYGVCELLNYAYSVKATYKFENYRVEILRAFNRAGHFNGFVLPAVRVEDSVIRFPFLLLGNTRLPHLPRAVFLHVTRNTPLQRPDDMFDLIQHYNRMLFLKFLRASEGVETPPTIMLRSAAFQQLETMSSYWGRRFHFTES